MPPEIQKTVAERPSKNPRFDFIMRTKKILAYRPSANAVLRLLGHTLTQWKLMLPDTRHSEALSKNGASGKTAAQSSLFRLSLNERIMFTKRMAILLKAGVPILEALKMLQKQTKNPTAKYIFQDIAGRMEHGQFLYTCLEKFRRHFGEFAISMIRVGEMSGTLHQNLDYLAEELRKKREMKKKVVSALIYPILIVLATIGITVVLITYVFPKILPVLQTFKGQLPFTTKTLIWISNILTTDGWLIGLILLGLAVFSVVLFRKSRGFRLWLDSVMLKIPILGRLFQSYHVANFCRTLGILLRSDARIVETIIVTAKTSTNLAYRDALMELSETLMKGEKISTFLEQHVELFPPMVWQLVAVGETTGSLSNSLTYLAEIYEKDVDEMTKNLSTAIEPVLMIFMGVLVGFIAMSIITPIYSLTQSLSR